MQIRKYQSAGSLIYVPTSNSTYKGGASNNGASSSNSTEEKVPGFAKEIISLIKENGLDSDVTVFLNQVSRVLDTANDPTGQNLSMREILKVQKLANRVKTNYEHYQKAIESLNKEEA